MLQIYYNSGVTTLRPGWIKGQVWMWTGKFSHALGIQSKVITKYIPIIVVWLSVSGCISHKTKPSTIPQRINKHHNQLPRWKNSSHHHRVAVCHCKNMSVLLNPYHGPAVVFLSSYSETQKKEKEMLK